MILELIKRNWFRIGITGVYWYALYLMAGVTVSIVPFLLMPILLVLSALVGLCVYLSIEDIISEGIAHDYEAHKTSD